MRSRRKYGCTSLIYSLADLTVTPHARRPWVSHSRGQIASTAVALTAAALCGATVVPGARCDDGNMLAARLAGAALSEPVSSVDCSPAAALQLPWTSPRRAQHLFWRRVQADGLIVHFLLKSCFALVEPIGEATQSVPPHAALGRSRWQRQQRGASCSRGGGMVRLSRLFHAAGDGRRHRLNGMGHARTRIITAILMSACASGVRA